MRGDFTRVTFKKDKHYSGVWYQQGRVSVDADANEQRDIDAYRLRTETFDLLGACAAPRDNAGFAIHPQSGSLMIGAGRCYVDGILCENEQQPGVPIGVSRLTRAVKATDDLAAAVANCRCAATAKWSAASPNRWIDSGAIFCP